MLFTARNFGAVQAIQVGQRNLRYQAPVGDGLGHSVDGSLSGEEEVVTWDP